MKFVLKIWFQVKIKRYIKRRGKINPRKRKPQRTTKTKTTQKLLLKLKTSNVMTTKQNVSKLGVWEKSAVYFSCRTTVMLPLSNLVLGKLIEQVPFIMMIMIIILFVIIIILIIIIINSLSKEGNTVINEKC